MEIEKLAQKLEPLMPEEVQQWLKARDTSDPELKALIDKQIFFAAHEVLGDFRNKVLLSLPPQNKSYGPINLGTVLYEEEKWPAGLFPYEVMENMAIFGRSGSGKTNLVFHMLEQLVERKIPFLFLDWKRTGRHLLPFLKKKATVYTPGRSVSPFPFNPFIPPPGFEINLYVNNLIDVMAAAYTLGDGARSLLQKTIKKSYTDCKAWPTLKDVLTALENLKVEGRAIGWKVTALRALQSLEFANLSESQEVSQEDLVTTLTKSFTFIELDGLNQGARKFLIPLLCLWIYHRKPLPT